jgi:acetyl-CoA carboxylase carboxyl transferase subunit alpha
MAKDSTNAEGSQTAFERVQLARHPDRPYTLDFIERMFEGFSEIHGDRRFADDPAIVCGFARFHGMPVLLVGHQKGRDTKQRQFRNFGMPKPEGYRKAIRAMKLAEKFDRPIFSFIDTPGAYPGIDAEERGQAEAIAYNLREMTKLTVPVLVTVIGEGGSGGALAIGVGDQVLMLENAIYSVISPEGCAAILWKDSSQAARAAEELRLTASDLKKEGIVDEVIDEPKGGAQNSHDEAARLLDITLCERLAESATHNVEDRLTRRYQKLRQLGKWGTTEGSAS